MTEKEKRLQQLEELKSGTFAGLYVVELRNSSFRVIDTWQYETKKEADRKFNELIRNGFAPAFLDSYIRFTYK